MKIEEAVKTTDELKATIDNYYQHIQYLQGQLATAKDLLATVETKLRIKKFWAELWAWVSALLAALLAIKCL